MAWLPRFGRPARAVALVAAIGSGCSSAPDSGPSTVEGPARPAPRVLGDVFCIEPPEVKGDLRTAWALSMEGSGAFASAMAVVAGGSLALVGTYTERLDLGTIHLKGDANGTQRPFLLMIGADGAPRWGKSFDGGWFPMAVRAGPGGEGVDVVAVSDFAPVDFGSGPVEGPGGIGSFDDNGRFLEVREVGELSFNGAIFPAMGPAGEIAFQDNNFQLVVVDAAGTLVWQKEAPTLVQGQLAFDAAGDLVAAVAFAGSVDWVSPPLNLDSFEGVLAKLDRAGDVRWLKRLGPEMLPMGLSIEGNSILITAVGSTTQDVVVVGLKDDGDVEPGTAWTRSFAVDPYLGAPAVTHALRDGGAYVFGVTPTAGDLGLGPVSRGGLYLARVDGKGATTATQVFRAAFPPYPLQVLAHGDDSAIVAGMFTSAIDLGTGTLRAASSDGTGMFIAKIDKGTPMPVASRCAVSKRPGVVLGDPSPIVPMALALSGTTLAITTGVEVLTVATTGGDPQLIATAQANTVGIVADATNVYWANAGSEGPLNGNALRDGAIMSAPLAGGEPKTLVDKLTGVVGIAIDAQNLYYSIAPVSQGTSVTLGKLMSIPLAGGTPKQLAAGYLQIGPLAARSGAAFLAGRSVSTGSPAIVRVTNDGAATLLAISDRTIAGMAVDDDKLYWLEFSELSERAEGQLRAAPLSGGSAKVLASKLSAPQGLAIIGDDLYFSSFGRQGADLLRLPKSGGTAGMMARGFATIGPIASDATRLAWVQRVDDFTWSLIVRRP